MNERRRHVNELAAQLHVESDSPLHVLQILRGDGSDGDIVDVDLLLADQIQQQIQGSLNTAPGGN